MYIWTRLPNETSKAYQAFEIYRDLGPSRSIEKVGERLGKNPTALARLSSKYGWVERANAFDAYMGQKKAEKMAEEIVEMDSRHAKQAQAIQEAVLSLLDRLQKETEHDLSYCYLDNSLKIKSKDIMMKYMCEFFRVYKEAANMERATRGGGEKRVKASSNAEAAPFPANETGPTEDGIDHDNSATQEAQPENEKVPAEARIDAVQGSPAPPTRLKKRHILVGNDASDSEGDSDEPQGATEAGEERGEESGKDNVPLGN